MAKCCKRQCAEGNEGEEVMRMTQKKIEFRADESNTSVLSYKSAMLSACLIMSGMMMMPTIMEQTNRAVALDDGDRRREVPAFTWQINTKKRVAPAKEISRLRRRLNKVVAMYADDEGLVPILPGCVQNMKSLFLNVKDRMFKGWTLFSNDRGALCLEKSEESTSAIINIGERQFSYSIDKGEDTHIDGIERFSVKNVSDVLSKLV